MMTPTQSEKLLEKINETCSRVERIEQSVMPLLELREDLQPIVNEAFRALIVELDELDGHFRSEDALFLIKKLLRNTRNLTTMLQHVEQLNDFIVDATPLLSEVTRGAIAQLDAMERRGLFRTARAARTVAERFSERFSSEQVLTLGDNAIELLALLERLAQPRVLRLARAATDALENDGDSREDVTMFGLWRRMRNPDTLRGMALLLDLCRALGQADAGAQLQLLEAVSDATDTEQERTDQ